MKYLPLILIFCCLISIHNTAKSASRLISLAPHTTELVYALKQGHRLVAVSDFSDFPSQASKLPSVSSYQGVDFEAIMRLQPDLILAWRGGNKPQDLARLEQLGMTLYYSQVTQLDDIAKDILALGDVLDAKQQADKLASDFRQRLKQLNRQYANQPTQSVFYYMWTKPLMSIGGNAWANHLLRVCGANNVFADSLVEYPQVTPEQVVRLKPDILVAAMDVETQHASAFWQGYRSLITSKLIVVNPDKLHRFTPRVLDELERLCEQLHPRN